MRPDCAMAGRRLRLHYCAGTRSGAGNRAPCRRPHRPVCNIRRYELMAKRGLLGSHLETRKPASGPRFFAAIAKTRPPKVGLGFPRTPILLGNSRQPRSHRCRCSKTANPTGFAGRRGLGGCAHFQAGREGVTVELAGGERFAFAAISVGISTAGASTCAQTARRRLPPGEPLRGTETSLMGEMEVGCARRSRNRPPTVEPKSSVTPSSDS